VWELSPGEFYENVSAEQIRAVLTEMGWEGIEARQLGLDTQGVAIKPSAERIDIYVSDSVMPVRTVEPREHLFGAVLSRTVRGDAGISGRS
jgi:hypothetical protein